MTMNNNSRSTLIASFLALPQSAIEQQWLIDAVRSAKESASNAMNTWEQYGASNLKSASEDDSFVLESDFFINFKDEKKDFEFWLAAEEELYQSIGYEQFFNKQQSEKIESRIKNGGYYKIGTSNILERIANNLMHHIAHGNDLLESATEHLLCIQKEVEEYGPEDKSDIDDEWFRLQNDLDFARTQLDSIRIILPHCWDSIRQFSMLHRAAKYIPNNLLQLVFEDDCDSFICEYFKMGISSGDATSISPLSNSESWHSDIPESENVSHKNTPDHRDNNHWEDDNLCSF